MADHAHHHHHARAAAPLALSLLRLSAGQRLAAIGLVLAMLWSAILATIA